MDLIILSDEMYHLVPVTKQMMEGISLVEKVLIRCFDLCEILRIKLSVYYEPPMNAHIMKDGSGDFFGCICK